MHHTDPCVHHTGPCVHRTEHPYNHSCGSCWTCAVPLEANINQLTCVLTKDPYGPGKGPSRPRQRTRTAQAKAPHNCLHVLYRRNVVRSPCLKDTHADLSATGYTGPPWCTKGVVYTVWYTCRIPGFSPLRGLLTAQKLPGSSM